MGNHIELGSIASDGIGIGRPYAGDNFAGSIYASFTGSLMVGYRRFPDGGQAMVGLKVKDAEQALDSVQEDATALDAIEEVLRDVRDRERSVVFGGVGFRITRSLATEPQLPPEAEIC